MLNNPVAWDQVKYIYQKKNVTQELDGKLHYMRTFMSFGLPL